MRINNLFMALTATLMLCSCSSVSSISGSSEVSYEASSSVSSSSFSAETDEQPVSDSESVISSELSSLSVNEDGFVTREAVDETENYGLFYLGWDFYLDITVSYLYTCGWKLRMYRTSLHDHCQNLSQIDPDLPQTEYLGIDFDQEGYFIVGGMVREDDSVEPSKKLVIPETYNGLQILGTIGSHREDCIIENSKFTNPIKGPEFANYETLEEIVLPEGFGFLDIYSFFGFTNLKKINFPSTLNLLSKGIFSDCPNVDLPSLDHIKADYGMILGTHFTEITYGSNLEYIKFPASSHNSDYLEKLDFSQTEMTTATYVKGCPNLTEIYYPDTLTSIESMFFRNCDSLTEIHYAGTMDQWLSLTRNEYTFQEGNVEEVICSDGTVQVNEDGTCQKAE